MRQLVEATPDATLDEFVVELAQLGIATNRSTLDRYFGRIGWSFKKTLHAPEQNRPDVKAAREIWREEQPALAIDSLVFIDELGFTANMARRSGGSPIGQRLLAKTPHGHWRTTTFIVALRSDGINAPMTLDGPTDGENFRA